MVENRSSCTDASKPKTHMQKAPACCTPRHERERAPADSSAFFNATQGTRAAQERRKTIALIGGRFLMGTDYPHGFSADGEGPVRFVELSAFEIDVFPVTNADFAAFVESTGYRTEAELFGWSFVFWAHIPQDRLEELVEDTVLNAPWWCKVPGAKWSQPEGPGSHVLNCMDHPVVHVSWNDAAAYARWAKRSLPTEAQWEYAARGGLEQKLYPWGDELTPDGKHLCNVWQGRFPDEDTAEDGYAGTCPVDSFPPNRYGLYSVTGNVWEWCSDWFTAVFVADKTLHDPTGPVIGSVKVMKGGSFLCHASYCNRYRVAARTSNTPDSSASNIGFRCVRTAPATTL